MIYTNYNYSKHYPDFSADKNLQKLDKAFTLVEKIFDFSSIPPQKIEKIVNIIKNDILTTKVGRKLIKELSKTGDKIAVNEGTTYAHSFHKNSIEINLNTQPYYVAENEEGKYFECSPQAYGLFHECLHALHQGAHSFEKHYRIPKENLFPEMDNGEEQVTITGIFNPRNAPSEFICDNTYFAELGKPNRVNHRALLLPLGEAPTMADCIFYGTTQTLKPFLNDPVRINTPESIRNYKIYDKEQVKIPSGTKLTPLSLAVWANRIDVVLLLLNHEASIEASDEIGGPIFAAIHTNRFGILNELLSIEGVKLDIKNPEGKSLGEVLGLTTELSEVVSEGFWNALDANGNNLLMRMIAEGNPGAIRDLLQNFSFDCKANFENDTPLKLADKHENLEIRKKMVSILLEYKMISPEDPEDIDL